MQECLISLEIISELVGISDAHWATELFLIQLYSIKVHLERTSPLAVEDHQSRLHNIAENHLC
jgi:hypothetical protein